MQNFILKYDTEEIDDYIVSNYFSKKINLWDVMTTEIKQKYMVLYKIDNNDKIERISYEIYKTTDYWDLLLLLNDREPLCGLPYDFQTYSTYSDYEIENYQNNIFANSKIDTTRYYELQAQFYEQCRINNESHRYIYIIRPELMQDFLKIIKLQGFEW